MDFKKYIASIPDFPQPGVLFRDITPLMSDGEAFHAATSEIQKFAEQVGRGSDRRSGIPRLHLRLSGGRESAYRLCAGPQAGQAAARNVSYRYDLEYGSNELHMHKDAITPGQKVLIVDDLLATGGTVQATIKMIEELGGVVVGCAFLIELEGLKGREALAGYEVFTLMSYE